MDVVDLEALALKKVTLEAALDEAIDDAREVTYQNSLRRQIATATAELQVN